MNWKPTSDTMGLVKAFDAKQDLLLFGMFNDALIESGSYMDAWGLMFFSSTVCGATHYNWRYEGNGSCYDVVINNFGLTNFGNGFSHSSGYNCNYDKIETSEYVHSWQPQTSHRRVDMPTTLPFVVSNFTYHTYGITTANYFGENSNGGHWRENFSNEIGSGIYCYMDEINFN